MATGVGVAQISNSPTPTTPCLVQEWGSYLPHMPSYSQFCVQITVLGCHGNKGQSGVNLKEGHRSIGRPQKPPVWCKQRARIFKGARVTALEVAIGLNAIFQIFGEK